MKRFFYRIPSLVLLICAPGFLISQYQMTEIRTIPCEAIEDQGRTGTCWSFASSSFLESELNRIYGVQIDLSEMYSVRKIYKEKAQNYLLRQGVAGFSQGALAHDLFRAAKDYGMIPEKDYPGTISAKHNHTELEAGMKGYLDGVLKSKPITENWIEVIEGILDVYLGKVPATFEWQNKSYDPVGFMDKYPIPFGEYLALTSFTHHPFYKKFILEIPDNFSNGSFYNIPIEDLYQAVRMALNNGYSVAWDGDVSEKGFNAKKGLAILAENVTDDSFSSPTVEMPVSQEGRQHLFNILETTDDHLMHIIGIAEDQLGNEYFIVKNSWGEIGPYAGKIYMSAPYFKMKTVSVHFHQGGLSEDMLKKLRLN